MTKTEAETKETTKLPKMENGDTFLFRMTTDGKVSEGHWKSKGRSIPKGQGFRFAITKERGHYFLKNEDYGWQKEVHKTDERGVVYDTLQANAQGFDFNNETFGDIDSALNVAVKWLQAREQIRKANQ